MHTEVMLSVEEPLIKKTNNHNNNNTSKSMHGTHVWVRTDLVEAIWKNGGQLPKGWRPRKRGRSNEDSDWGWARALVSASTNASTNSSTPNQSESFENVKLRKITNSPKIQERSGPASSWLGSPGGERASKTVSITITMDDPELAPPEIQNVTVSFTYNTGEYSKVCMANTWWQQGEEPPQDLTSLAHLHEPAVVFCLQQRYEWDYIYTYTGKILLALNPFRPLENVYSEHIMQQYWDQDFTSGRPPPHIYAVAEDAYRSMMRSLQTQLDNTGNSSKGQGSGENCNQSILVSGESGAGKTVTTKIIMRYLATLSQRLDQRKSAERGKTADVGIESQVLQSNPILESFGNARTVRNDNSSRFGKFIEIMFARSGCLVSASIETYLLEKVRLITQAPGERNYHVFYELLAGLPQKDRRDLKIGNAKATDFKMTAASGTFDRRDGVDDKQTYLELKSALDTVGFTRDEQMDLFTVACALLHASNLTFKESGSDASELDRSNPSLRSAVELLGVGVDALNDALCRCAIDVRGETLYKHLSVARAEKAAEALIKTTYGALFDHIVRRINSFITVRQKSNQGGSAVTTASIGVLDIFGFESFERNSFEQLCINFCNEALQQQFNRFVFKLEQQEYQKEGIEWSFIAFPDNQDVLDLIEKKHDGILSVLDEQCRLPKCTDKSFASAMYAKCSDHPRFEATKGMQADLAFAVHHYAGLVEYDTYGFLEKNKDELPKETTELLLSSSYPFLSLLGRELSEGSSLQQPIAQRKAPGSRKQLHRAASSLMRDSVGSQFSSQLRELRKRIESTSPHYVRCLKPNDDLVPNSFDNVVIGEQLRCAGVLEAIRVSRVGFPHRYFHDHFVERYGLLGGSKLVRSIRKEKAQELCEVLVGALVPQLSHMFEQSGSNEEMVVKSRHGKSLVFLGMQMGRTKVFLRMRAFEALEHLRSNKVDTAATSIQSMARMFIARARFEIAVFAAAIIQNFVRRVGAYRLMKARRLYDSSIIIQNAWKCFVPRRRLRAGRCIAWWCQSIHRGTVARQYCAYLFLDGKASSIQRGWKHYCASRTFRRIRKAVVRLQNRQRSRVAFRELLRLRREARDLSSVAAERDTLKQETRRLRKELEHAKQSPPAEPRSPKRKELEAENLRFEVQRLRVELEKAHRMTGPSMSVDGDLQSLVDECTRKEEQLDLMRRELDAIRGRDFPESPSFVRRPFTFDESPVGRGNIGLNSSFHQASPVRADVSLLDAEGEGPTAMEGAISFQSLREEESASRSLTSFDLSEGPTGEEIRHLQDSIRLGKTKLFDQVLRQSNDPIVLVNQGDNFGRTSLHLAVITLNLKLVETLIGKGAVANTNDNDGETPLHLAENAAMTEVLLKKGKANPNIPNVDGICALHLAVQRRDIDSVRALLRNGACVNNADNIRWFTALHLISLPARKETDDRVEDDTRSRIAHLLSGTYAQNEPDFNYQDSEGNTPLHYAVQLETPDACDLVTIFLEKGADPNICNERDQSPLHLLCHNEELRSVDVYQEILHVMLFHGADPNLQSMTGCTPLHLILYHRDIDSAVQLVTHGAELHVLWRKPSRWVPFWDDMGAPEILALDMVEDENSLHRILAAVTRPVKWAPSRSWCMHCKDVLGTYARALHCRNCSRLVCGKCAPSCLPAEDFPKSFEVTEASWVCTICEKILAARKEDMSGTQPTNSYGDDDDDDRFSC